MLMRGILASAYVEAQFIALCWRELVARAYY